MRTNKTLFSGTLILFSMIILLLYIPKATAIHSQEKNCSNEPKYQDLTYSDLMHYAYMDISTVDPSLQELILYSRNQIIHSTSWVSDDVNGRIKDSSGNTLYELPHFHEIFPEDWEEPIYSTE